MSEEKIKQLIKNIITDFINEEKNKIKPPKSGYHVTYLSNMKNILKNGLRLPKHGHKLTTGVGEDAIYLFVEPSRTKYTAGDIGLDRKKDWVLLKIDNLDPKFLRGDADYTLDSDSISKNWNESIKYGGTFAYAHNIPPENVKIVATAKNTKKYRHDEFDSIN